MSLVGAPRAKNKAHKPTNKKRPLCTASESVVESAASSSKAKKARKTLSISDTDPAALQVDEEILQRIESKRPCDKKTGPSLPNLATRVNRCWKDESENESTCKYIEGEYSIPDNYSKLVVPKINREVFTRLQPYQRRQDSRYMGIQETLLCTMTIVAKIANLALDADNASDPVDTTELGTHAPNAVKRLGNVHRKLNNKRKGNLVGLQPQ